MTSYIIDVLMNGVLYFTILLFFLRILLSLEFDSFVIFLEIDKTIILINLVVNSRFIVGITYIGNVFTKNSSFGSYHWGYND